MPCSYDFKTAFSKFITLLVKIERVLGQMKIVHYQDVAAKEVEEGFKLKMRWLNPNGSETVAVRHCEFEPGGYSPLHSHRWEHEMFILEGQGSVIGEKEAKAVVAGCAISIPAGETHQVKNTSEKTLRLLCMIPK